jgi:hypothetical protein
VTETERRDNGMIVSRYIGIKPFHFEPEKEDDSKDVYELEGDLWAFLERFRGMSEDVRRAVARKPVALALRKTLRTARKAPAS